MAAMENPEDGGAVARLMARPIVRQFLRFATIGGLATIVHYAIMIALVEWANVAPIVATSIGFGVGAVISYTLNRRFTFEHRPAFGRGLFVFLCVFFVGLCINGLIFTVLHGPSVGLPYIIAQGIATGVVLIWNFFGARLVVFRG